MRKAKAILLGLMLCAITAVGHAQVTIDVAKITCNQFATYKIADPENIALWLSGYHNGKHGVNLEDSSYRKGPQGIAGEAVHGASSGVARN